MKVPKDVILIWLGTHAGIPSGFVRETTLDSKYPKGANGGNQNTPGGADTHTHTSPVHSHTMASHTHTYTTSTVNGDNDAGTASGGKQAGNHYHTGTTDTGSASTTSSDSATYGAFSNDPPYKTVIYIKAQNNANPPVNGIVLYNQTTVPTNWALETTLANKYLKGAATGADAGSTGGSTTNVHSLSHSHTPSTHTHSGTSGGQQGGSGVEDFSSGSVNVSVSHTHAIGANAASQPIDDYASSLTTTETVEPLYKKLLALKNTADNKLPLKAIGLWLGSIASIPNGWVVCDGTHGTPDMRNYHLKIAASSAEIGNTGGSNTHTHASQSHTHSTSSGHSHSGQTDAHTKTMGIDGVGSASALRASTQHTFTTSTTTASYGSANTTADSANNEPSYVTAHFIQYIKEPHKAAFLLMLFAQM